MGKIFVRLLIIIAIVFGVWFLFNFKFSDNSTKPANDSATNNTKINKTNSAEKTDEEPVKSAEKTSSNPAKKVEKTVNIQKSNHAEAQSVKNLNTGKNTTETNSQKTESVKNVEKATAGPEQIKTTTVNVYLYEYAVDISQKRIPAGKVNFKVVNNGRLAHDFSLNHHDKITSLGKLAPQETKTFTMMFTEAGNFAIFSQTPIDVANSMSETPIDVANSMSETFEIFPVVKLMTLENDK